MYIGEGGGYPMYIVDGGYPMYVWYGGYPVYIGEGAYPMYTFGQKSRTEPEYPLLRGPSASCTLHPAWSAGWTLSART